MERSGLDGDRFLACRSGLDGMAIGFMGIPWRTGSMPLPPTVFFVISSPKTGFSTGIKGNLRRVVGHVRVYKTFKENL